jgi:putative NADH-flavin reductase
MKLAVFGSTGGTGQHLVRLGLEAGHDVIAFARSPSKLEIEDERLSIVQGNVTDPAPVSEAICGVDAVLSALGPPRGVPAGVMGEGLDNILAAMGEHGVRRLLIVVGAGVGDPQDRPKLFDRLIGGALRLISREFYDEMMDLTARVRASDLDWTLVRVPMLTDDPGTGDVRAGYLGVDAGTRLSREDLARFMIEQVDQETYVRQAPVISNS